MRVAVIGKGSAGCLAAAHISKRFPDYELVHIYNSKIPIIGVGEGTLPGLPLELVQLTGMHIDDILNRLKGTRKYGIQFENWGKTNQSFFHHFHPKDDTYGFHLSADTLVELLDENTNADVIDANVKYLNSTGIATTLEFEDRSSETFDVVFDARGFPKNIDPKEHIQIPFIPTNSAIIRRCPAQSAPVQATRAVARPHGWIFVIPLQIHTSYGYIYNADITSTQQVEADFDQFLQEDNVTQYDQRAVIQFPNYISRKIYDGSLARIGNTAGFMEPLEATALGLIERQIAVILETRLAQPDSQSIVQDAQTVNRHLISWAWKFGIFISWHYMQGSAFNSAFWTHAKNISWPACASATVSEIDTTAQYDLFQRYVEAGCRMLRGEPEELIFPPTYGGFTAENFADMAQGLNIRGLQYNSLPRLAVNQ